MRFTDRSLWQRGVIIFTLVYVGGFSALLLFHPGSKDFFENVFDLCEITPHLFAGCCCLKYARRGLHDLPVRRRGWLLISLACFTYLFGDAVWYVYLMQTNGKPPFPSWADAAWLAVIPLQAAGILLLPGKMPAAGRIRLLLDSAITACSVGVLSWHFLVQEMWQRSGISLLGKIVSVSYPLGDIVCLFCAFVLLNSLSGNREMRRSLILLACGTISWSFSDTLYTYARFHNTFQTGNWTDSGWPFGALMMTYAALLPLWAGRNAAIETEKSLDRQAAVSGSLLRLLAPYLAAGIALLTIFGDDYRGDGSISRSVFLLGLGLVALVMLRQVFTLWENRHLTGQLGTQLTQNRELMSQLRAFNENLEHSVEQRTQQLGAMLELTKAVNSTLLVDDVLEAAMCHVRQAMQTSMVLVWLPGSEEGAEDCFSCQHRGLEARPGLAAFCEQQAIRDRMEALPLPLEMQAGGELCMRAPLLWQSRVVGMIGVIRVGASIEPTEWEMLQGIGVEIGAALENARLYRAALDAADKDPVTGLYNHRAIHHHLDRELARAQRSEGVLAAIMLDINNFKLFNDTYGHPIGDQVLKTVARALQEEARAGDYAGRYGGDEFLLVLSDTDMAGAVAMAERLQARVGLSGYQRAGEERTIPITLSFGIATYPMDSTNRFELLTIADTNLYAAKQTEGGGIRATSTMQRANRQLRVDSSFEVLDAMVTAVDNKDSYTRHHSEDVTAFALMTAEELGLSEETMRQIRIGGLLHDVGKIGVPGDVLRKPGKLTPEEYEVMKRHPRLGALIVGAIPGMEGIVDVVRSHHERWDGHGYPDGTAGEETPFLGRLLAVADAFSAMTTDRPYRKGMPWEKALGEIKANIGTQFDPVIAQAFLRAANKRLEQEAQEAAPLRLAA